MMDRVFHRDQKAETEDAGDKAQGAPKNQMIWMSDIKNLKSLAGPEIRPQSEEDVVDPSHH